MLTIYYRTPKFLGDRFIVLVSTNGIVSTDIRTTTWAALVHWYCVLRSAKLTPLKTIDVYIIHSLLIKAGIIRIIISSQDFISMYIWM